MTRVSVNWRGSEFSADLSEHKRRALFNGLNFLKQKSNAIAPLDTNMLIGTSTVENDDQKGTFKYVQPYAVRVHEKAMNFQRGRQHKYLERPVRQYKGQIGQIVLQELKKAFD